MRISSEGLQKRIFILGDPLAEDEFPDRLSLYLPDGTPIDLLADPNRMRWQGIWDISQAYAYNDVISYSGSLYIYLEDGDSTAGVTPIAPFSGWVNMASSSAMRFTGEWIPGSYQPNDVVINDNKLWIAKEAIEVAPFEFVANASSNSSSSGINEPITVPVETAVGDLMIYAHFSDSSSTWYPPTTGGWTTLLETTVAAPLVSASRLGIYGKVVEAGDLGDVLTVPSGPNYQTIQLHVFRGAVMPDPADVDVNALQTSGYVLLTLPAGTDPAETTSADKVMRIFASIAQNGAYNSGVYPQWEAGAPDGQDLLISDAHQIRSMGAYWADPDVENPPDYKAMAGEYRGGAAVVFPLPSPAGFDETKWTLIGSTVPDSMRWLGAWDIAEEYMLGDVVFHDDAIWSAPGPLDGGVEPGVVPDDAVIMTNRGVVVYESDRFASTTPVLFTIGPPPGMRRDNDIGVGYSAMILLDKTAALTGTTMTITPMSHASSSGLDVYLFTGPAPGYSSGTNVSWTDAEVNAHTPKTFSVDVSGTDDLYLHCFFGGGVDGSFTAKLNSSANLIAPPNPLLFWDLVLESGGGGSGLPIGGAIDQLLAKASAEDGDAVWIDAPGDGDITIEAWHDVGAAGEPGFANSWVAHSSSYKPQFRKRPDGVVELRGLIKSGGYNAVAFTLPVGYRPVGQTELYFAQLSSDIGTWVNGPLRISSDGTVVALAGGSDWFSLACEFATDQTTFPAGDVTGGGAETHVISPEKVSTSSSIAPGAEYHLTFAHGLGYIPGTIMGALEDGSWAHACCWRVGTKDATNIELVFRNFHPTEYSTPVLRWRSVKDV